MPAGASCNFGGILRALPHVALSHELYARVITTDTDVAMAAAVENLLLSTMHLVCLWHKFRNNNVVEGCAMGTSRKPAFYGTKGWVS